MAQQAQPEGRIAGRPGLPRPRGLRGDQPAAAGGAGPRRCGPQHQRDDVGGFGDQRQAPAGREVELAGFAPGLDQNRPDGRTACGLRSRPQHGHRVPRSHQQDPARIEPELGEARRVGPAGFGIDAILPHPEDRPVARRPPGKAERESGRSRKARRAGRKDLVQGCPDEASAQGSVEFRRADLDPARLMRPAQIGTVRQKSPQIGKGG